MTHWMQEIQNEVGQWSEANFGDPENAPADMPLIGAGEEIGELTTSVLKRRQGIDDSEKYEDIVGPEAEKDAIGDITIYMLDAVHRMPYDADVSRTFETQRLNEAGYYADDEDDISTIREIYRTYAKVSDLEICTDNEKDFHIEYAVGTFFAVLNEFCVLRGYDYEQCVRDAWIEVSDRKWDADVER